MSRTDHYFSSQQLRAGLKGKTVRGGLYTAVSQVLVVLINLAAIPILARLLSPSDFGLVAMVSVFTGLAAMFVDAGLTMATVQREELTHQQVTNLFWLATALGLLIALFVAAASPLLAWFYDEPRLIAITIAMSAATFFSGLTIQHQTLLRRAMQSRTGRVQRSAVGLAGITAYGCES